jgi:hypothetical protein
MKDEKAEQAASRLTWVTSSYSSEEGGECVEVAVTWRTSSYSSGEGGQCVEVATCPHTVHVRDSKDKAGPTLGFGPDAWAAFVGFAAGNV